MIIESTVRQLALSPSSKKAGIFVGRIFGSHKLPVKYVLCLRWIALVRRDLRTTDDKVRYRHSFKLVILVTGVVEKLV